MSAVSSPAAVGTDPQAAVKRSRPASRLTRPGRMPGARPMSRAPKTLPRRSAGRKRRLGQRVGEGAQRLGSDLARLGVGGAARHHDDALPAGVFGQEAARRVEGDGAERRALVVRAQRAGTGAPSSPLSARAIAGASPGRMRSDAPRPTR